MRLHTALLNIVRALVSLSVFAAGAAMAQQARGLLGVNCAAPPAYHCPDTDCPASVLTQPGDSVELKTRRSFFLDCPADYKPGDKVNIILSLHGYGSFANWQKGHTEGYEPNITDKFIELALSAKGGKIATGVWVPPPLPAAPRGPFG
ncbi:MAG TPA: hypothetical protein VHW71_06070 [Steroidobacteraceae bacterium]|jgi:hypothetical protein|nr:hypothetical protein [Steroidobacteraceae bacterium]